MKIKTISTVTGLNIIHFEGYTHHYYWLKNLSDSTLYVSVKPNPVVGADDVAELPAKGSTAIETDEGVIYILGAGKVEIHNTDSKLCPFETPGTGSGGGGTVAVDSSLSDTSENPVQNKVIKTALDGKANITDIPSNPNLLDNPDFKINQRGETKYTNEYCVDRWVAYNASCVVNDDGIDLSNSGNLGYFGLYQKNEISSVWLTEAKVLTFSLATKTTTYKHTFDISNMPIEEAWTVRSPQFDGMRAELNWYPNDKVLRCIVIIFTSTHSQIHFSWIKLELGSVATLFVPPNPATELVKCQRYYQIRSTGNVANCDLRPNMRDGVNPTITALSDGTYSYDAEIR